MKEEVEVKRKRRGVLARKGTARGEVEVRRKRREVVAGRGTAIG